MSSKAASDDSGTGGMLALIELIAITRVSAKMRSSFKNTIIKETKTETRTKVFLIYICRCICILYIFPFEGNQLLQ